MRIINKKFSECSVNMRRSIRSLCLRGEGYAMCELSRCPDLDMFICIDNNNVLLGWALCDTRLTPPRIMIYVRQSMRCRGIGSKLMKTLGRKYKCHSVCPWNSKSRRFFKKYVDKNHEITVAKGWRF